MLAEPNQTQTHPNLRTRYQTLMFPVLITLLVVGTIGGVVVWQAHEVSGLNTVIGSSRANIQKLATELQATDNLNNGIVTTAPGAANTVSLANAQVTFSMPVGWVAATAGRFYQQCYNGAYNSKVTCLDTTTIVPNALNMQSSSSTYGGISIAVYKHDDTTSASDWFTNDFQSAGEYESSGNQTSNTRINGYDTLYVNTSKATLEYGDQFNDEFYIVVNKSYVVRVVSNVNNNAGPNGTTVFNDNSQYSPVVKAFVNTIKMQGN